MRPPKMLHATKWSPRQPLDMTTYIPFTRPWREPQKMGRTCWPMLTAACVDAQPTKGHMMIMFAITQHTTVRHVTQQCTGCTTTGISHHALLCALPLPGPMTDFQNLLLQLRGPRRTDLSTTCIAALQLYFCQTGSPIQAGHQPVEPAYAWGRGRRGYVCMQRHALKQVQSQDLGMLQLRLAAGDLHVSKSMSTSGHKISPMLPSDYP